MKFIWSDPDLMRFANNTTEEGKCWKEEIYKVNIINYIKQFSFSISKFLWMLT